MEFGNRCNGRSVEHKGLTALDLTDKTDEKIKRLQRQVENERKEFVKILSFLASKIEALYETIYDISPEHAEVLSVSERRLLETWKKNSN